MDKRNFLEKTKQFFLKFKKLGNDDLKKVSGAGEPEEFGWESKGYNTPVKEDPKDGGFEFKPIGDNKNK